MKFLTLKQVMEITSLSRTHIKRLEDRGAFPRRRKLTDAPNGRVGWPDYQVWDWIKTRPVEYVRSPDASEDEDEGYDPDAS